MKWVVCLRLEHYGAKDDGAGRKLASHPHLIIDIMSQREQDELSRQ